jgi:hypothetical protein
MSLTLDKQIPFKNKCPVCNIERFFKTERNLYLSNKSPKPCRSCSNSIQAGGVGKLFTKDLKACSYCREYKSFNEFKLNKNSGNLNSRCIPCQKEYNNHYGKNRGRWIKYGIDESIFNDLLIKQDHKCKICNININKPTCTIDHDHNTNEVRGLLCRNCNTALGLFNDNINSLLNAIKYLTINK